MQKPFSPINDPPSKTHWSLAKSSRFRRPKFYCDSIYHIPGVAENKNRMACIGQDKKINLDIGKHPHNIVPSPDTYNIFSFVDANQVTKRDFSPLFSREIHIRLYKKSLLWITLISNSRKCWDQADLKNIDAMIRPNGPCAHAQMMIVNHLSTSASPTNSSQSCLLPVSTTAPNKSAIIHLENIIFPSIRVRKLRSLTLQTPKDSIIQIKSQSTKQKPLTSQVPSTNLKKISSEGKYVLSRHLGAGKKAFTEGRRQSFEKLAGKRSTTHGPDSYRASSDFRYHDSKKERQEGRAAARCFPEAARIQTNQDRRQPPPLIASELYLPHIIIISVPSLPL